MCVTIINSQPYHITFCSTSCSVMEHTMVVLKYVVLTELTKFLIALVVRELKKSSTM